MIPIGGLHAQIEEGTLVIRVPVRFDVQCFDAVPVTALGLSPAEEKVYRAILNRSSNKEIATELGVSVSTIKFHVASILRKAHAESRAELVYRAKG